MILREFLSCYNDGFYFNLVNKNMKHLVYIDNNDLIEDNEEINNLLSKDIITVIQSQDDIIILNI